ncbi:hypothetical protein NDU88_004064 [Pleurodeles waltl]|uniref:Uncharacterized protein n=1 Tax=Pleurodeles waltl TaxID=8319 RepID=A0AAV7KZV6_PLEWA|nr:hypothetical protein NDU88_004064 [Pleurodeles waltl]
MGRHRQTVASQGNTMEQYTTPASLSQRQIRLGGPEDGLSTLVTGEEPLRAEIFASIQGSRLALEGKIEKAAVEVNLLTTDLRKVSDKVTKGFILDLQMEAYGLDSLDWTTRGYSQVEGTAAQVVATYTDHRIENQLDGTMAVVTPGSVDRSSGELEQGADRINAHV